MSSLQDLHIKVHQTKTVTLCELSYTTVCISKGIFYILAATKMNIFLNILTDLWAKEKTNTTDSVSNKKAHFFLFNYDKGKQQHTVNINNKHWRKHLDDLFEFLEVVHMS